MKKLMVAAAMLAAAMTHAMASDGRRTAVSGGVEAFDPGLGLTGASVAAAGSYAKARRSGGQDVSTGDAGVMTMRYGRGIQIGGYADYSAQTRTRLGWR